MGNNHGTETNYTAVPPVRYLFWLSLVAVGVALLLTWPTSGSVDNGAVYARVPGTVSRSAVSDCGVNRCVDVSVSLADGTVVPLGLVSSTSPLGLLEVGSPVVLGFEESTGFYFFLDFDRRVELWVLLALFAGAVLLFTRKAGLFSLVSIAALAAMLYKYTAPALLSGADPVAVCTLTAAVAVIVSAVASHGVRSSLAAIATLSMLVSLGVAWLLVSLAAQFFGFSGAISDEAALVRSVYPGLDFAGLLYGSIIIGFAGALDDVVLTQVATVAELSSSDGSRRTVFSAAMRVGRAHLAAAVNTLLLAYLGASLPLLLLFSLSNSQVGLVASEEVVAAELVRMVLGTLGLVAAIPIASAGAVFLLRPSSLVPGGKRLRCYDVSARNK